jgi:hypothetical protein
MTNGPQKRKEEQKANDGSNANMRKQRCYEGVAKKLNKESPKPRDDQNYGNL